MSRKRTISRRAFAGRIAVACVALVAIANGVVHTPQASYAASASDFNPGYLISDSLFFDGTALSVAQVQGFLDSKVSSCRTGYTCLKNYSEVTASIPANPMCAAYTATGRESAAEIIVKVGQACGISPKAILVTLQKEQSLVTDTWPTISQYSAAMGALCPDTAPCDSAASGFFKQVYTGAYLFKRYTQPPGTGPGTDYSSRFDLSYPVGRTSAIQYNPDADCGTAPVYVQNQATHALYVYTPYTPNAAALANLYGAGDSCSAHGNRNFWRIYTDWFGSTSANSNPLSPIGHIDGVSNGPGSAKITGWAFDPETAAPISIHAYVGAPYDRGGTWGGAYTANRFNGWVAVTYPSYGMSHGFDITISGLSAPTQVCLYALNIGVGSTTVLGCPVVIPQSGSPVANFEGVSANGLNAVVQGWAIDPDTSSPVVIHAYTGGAYGVGVWAGQFTANASRDDVARAFPLYGLSHGMSFSVPVGIGTTPICLYAIDVQSPGGSVFLGCKAVTTAQGSPYGNIDGMVASPGAIRISGWAMDPESLDPVDIHVYVDGQWGGAYSANQSRPDVGAVYSGYGNSHGLDISVPSLSAGRHNVCVYAINVGVGSHVQLGCRTVEIAGGNPFGNIDGQSVTGSNVVFGGWVIDPDTTSAVSIHAYVNGGWSGLYTADSSRADVGQVFPQYGNQHGFGISIPVPVGSNTVCLYAINVGAGTTNPLLGCRQVIRP